MRIGAISTVCVAVAVGGVVLFHAFPWLLTGGYVGVDVFFVISGYLITAIITRQASAGKFSIWDFYERRFRRIIPALTVVVIATTFAAIAILPPHELRAYGKSLAAVALFASNIQFWRDGRYFDGPAEAKPLLHTWSLAVEEQFYLLWPLIAAGLIVIGRTRALKILVWLTVLGSLVAAELVVRSAPTAAFFLLPFRAWELGLGALLGIGAIPEARSRVVAEIEAVAGACMIVGSMIFMTSDTPFPGISAIPACLGTALLLHSGLAANTSVGRLLSIKPILFTGLISYSFYLWHWPILALARIASNGSLSMLHAAIAVVAAYGLAAASLRFVERPFRSGGLRLSRARVLAGTAMIGALFVGAGLTLMVTRGLYDFVDPRVQVAEAATTSISPFRNKCHADDVRGKIGSREDCTGGMSSAQDGYRVLLWGDSHADHLMPGLTQIAAQDGWSVRQVSVSGCTPVSRYLSKDTAPNRCLDIFRQGLLEAAQQPQLGAVVFSIRWSSTLPGIVRSAQRHGGDTVTALKRFRDATAQTIQEIRNAVGQDVRIIVIGSTPEYDIWPATCAARAAKMDRQLDECVNAEPKDAVWGAAADKVLAGLENAHVTVVLPRTWMCSGDECSTMSDGDVLFRDDDHLTNEGSVLLAQHVRPVLEDVLRAKRLDSAIARLAPQNSAPAERRAFY